MKDFLIFILGIIVGLLVMYYFSMSKKSNDNQIVSPEQEECVTTSLQIDSSEHLMFNGVPIDGTLNEYVSKMKQKGFTLISTKNGVALLNGDFATYKNCIISVTSLDQADLVSKISVEFPECETWSFLSENYFNLKKMLTQKYGKASNCVEKFDSYSEPRDDGDRIYCVKFDEYEYYTTFETDKGTIKLSIEHESVSKCYVMLRYYDKINSGIIQSKAIDVL